MAHRRSTTPASPAEQLAANLDTLLLERDDYSMIRQGRQGVGGMTIVENPSPSVAVSGLTGSGSIGGGRFQYTPRVNVASSLPRGASSSVAGGQASASRGGFNPPNSAAQSLMRSAGGFGGGGLSVAESQYGTTRAGYIGKDKVKISVVYDNTSVTKRERRCFGFIGEKGVARKFCLCTVGTDGKSCGYYEIHNSKKFEWPYATCPIAYAVPGKGSRPQSFVEPMICKDEVLPKYMTMFDTEFHTSAEWTEIIVEAKQAWQQHQYTQAMDDERVEEGDEEANESQESGEAAGEWYISPTPGFEDWDGTSAISIPDMELDLLQRVPPNQPYTGPLLEHQDALLTNNKKFKILVDKVPLSVDQGINHIKPVVEDLVKNTNAAAVTIGKLADVVGDITDLRKVHGHDSLADGVLAALELVDTVGDIQAVWTELNRLGELLGGVDDDVNNRIFNSVSKIMGSVNPKLQTILQRLGDLELRIPSSSNPVQSNPMLSNPTPINPVPSQPLAGTSSLGVGTSSSGPPSSLLMSSVILKDDGTPSAYTLGSMIATLEAQAITIDKLKADITAQGGVTLGSFSYPSEASLGALIRKEGVRNGKSCMSAIVDPISIFVHDVETSTSSLGQGWSDIAKSMRAAGIDTEVDRYLVHSCSRRNVPAYHKGTDAPKPGDVISVLASMDTWNGEGGRDGAAQTIMNALDSAMTKLSKHIEDYTPENSELQRLANYCATKARSFHSAIHDHVRSEMIKLVQMGVPESESLILMSEQILLIFNRFFEQRKLILQHREGMDMADFTTRVVWVTLKTQVVAAEFLADGIRNHQLTGNAFLRFLTKQTGQNVSTQLGPRITNVEDLLKAEVRKLESAIKKHTTQLDKNENWKQGLLSKNELKKP